METIKDFIVSEAVELAIVILGAIFTCIGAGIRKAINNVCDTKVKREIALVAVTAVEQMYKHLDGEEKFMEAVKYITTTLDAKGITIDREEGIFLIESAVHEMNQIKDELGGTYYSAVLESTEEDVTQEESVDDSVTNIDDDIASYDFVTIDESNTDTLEKTEE